MSVAQSSGTGATTELDDEKVRKNDILSNRDKAQRPPAQGLDGRGVQVDEYKDTPSNRRPSSNESNDEGRDTAALGDEKSDEAGNAKKVDRPGFDLGGSSGKTDAGKGLGLGDDAKDTRKGWGLPR